MRIEELAINYRANGYGSPEDFHGMTSKGVENIYCDGVRQGLQIAMEMYAARFVLVKDGNDLYGDIQRLLEGEEVSGDE